MADTYPAHLNYYRTRRNEYVYLYPLMSSLQHKFAAFKTYKNMLSLGPGPGQYDIELMERSLPSLEHYTAVECDEYCRNALDKNLKVRMGDKLKWKICKEDMLTWENKSRFDIVMISHCLYNTKKQERKDLLKKCLDHWLTPNGVLLLIDRSTGLDEQGNTQDAMEKIKASLDTTYDVWVEMEEMLENVKEIGGDVLFKQQYEGQIDFKEFGEDITFIFNIAANPIVGSDAMKDTVEKLNLPGGIGRYFAMLALIRKK